MPSVNSAVGYSDETDTEANDACSTGTAGVEGVSVPCGSREKVDRCEVLCGIWVDNSDVEDVFNVAEVGEEVLEAWMDDCEFESELKDRRVAGDAGKDCHGFERG